MVPIWRDDDGYVLVGVANFETDDWARLRKTLDWLSTAAPAPVQMVRDAVGWLEVEPRVNLEEGHLVAEFDVALTELDFMAVALFRARGEG